MADPRIQVPSNCELTLGMVCIDKSQPGRTVWKMLADERFANPAGIVQGGFLAAFADSAMGSATLTFATARQTRVFSANVEMKTSFMAPARVGEMLECAAEVVSGGTRVAFVEAEVTDSTGRLLSRSSSTYLLTPREPSPS
ncbi:MAG: PaaI family thioesterase [Acidimicrobiales bacterium]